MEVGTDNEALSAHVVAVMRKHPEFKTIAVLLKPSGENAGERKIDLVRAETISSTSRHGWLTMS
jgi:hypothetical protein